jgi:hypothetical protein
VAAQPETPEDVFNYQQIEFNLKIIEPIVQFG